MINYAIIGTPQGFKCEQWNFIPDNTVDAKQLADYTETQLDIKTKLILPSKTAELFVFKTEFTNGKKLDYFILYRGADEINATRPGSFYGSAIIVLNREFISIEEIITALRELADIVKTYCIQNNRFKGMLSLADEKLSTFPPSIKKLSEVSKQTNNNQAVTNTDYPAKFFLVDELNVKLETAAFRFYEGIIKKYQQADVYFSLSEFSTALPISPIPQKKPKIAENINVINNDDIFTTPQELNLFADKKPITVHQPKQNIAQSKSLTDTNIWVFIALIGTVLSLLVSVVTLVIVLSKSYSQNSNHQTPDLSELTNTISQLRADIDKLKGELLSASKETKTTSDNIENKTVKTDADKLKDSSSRETKIENGSNPSQLVKTSNDIPFLYTVKNGDSTDAIAINICGRTKYKCSPATLKSYKEKLRLEYKNIKEGDEIKISPEKIE